MMIQQQVMSRTLLGRTMEEFKLYKGQVEKAGLESAIEGMRKPSRLRRLELPAPGGKALKP